MEAAFHSHFFLGHAFVVAVSLLRLSERSTFVFFIFSETPSFIMLYVLAPTRRTINRT